MEDGPFIDDLRIENGHFHSYVNLPNEMHALHSQNSPNIHRQNANESNCKGPCQKLQRRRDGNLCCMEKTKTQAVWAHT